MTAPTLVEFLRARLGEDEAVARDASYPHPRWEVRYRSDHPAYHDARPTVGTENIPSGPGRMVSHGLAVVPPHQEYDGNKIVAHIARHDPARVLADVEAKRRIVEYVEAASMDRRRSPEHDAFYRAAWWVAYQLALPYRDHPDYDESWAV